MTKLKRNGKTSPICPMYSITIITLVRFEQQLKVKDNRWMFSLDHLLVVRSHLIPFVDKRKKLTASDGGR